jgi:hydroxypyruvate isomerase
MLAEVEGQMNRREFARLGAAAAVASRWAPAVAQVGGSATTKFSFMLWALAKQAPFETCVEWVAAAGYQGVELVGEFQSWSPGQRGVIMAKLRRLGLVVDAMSGVRAGFAVPGDVEAFRAQFVEQLKYAKELECATIILLSGKRDERLAAGVQRQASIEALKWAADMAAKEQIGIVIEPIDLLENPTIYLSSVTEGFEIARAVGRPNVKVLYDFYHEQRSFGNLIEKLEKNIDLVGLVHVADVPGRHEPGTGEVDFSAVYRKLAELKYGHWIAMEYYPTTEPVASLKKARMDALQAMGQG